MGYEILFTALALLSVLLSGCQAPGSMANNTAGLPVQNSTPAVQANSPAASQLDSAAYQALLTALADERRAAATYKAVITKFGDVRPFTNIVNAERRHESFLLPLFQKYGLPVPANTAAESTTAVPDSLVGACQQGVDGEKANIAMYDKFLASVQAEDIGEVFTYLRDASRDNHLPAFERCVSRGGRQRGQ